MSPHRQAVLELKAKGLEPWQIRRKLNISKGTVAGILWRESKYKPIPRKGPPRIYDCNTSLVCTRQLLDEINVFAKEMKIRQSEAVRLLIAFGLDSLEGE